MPSCHKCPHTNYRPWPDNGMIPKWGNGKGGIKASEAEWEDTPCSECELDDDKPNNQGKTFISLDALHLETGTDFDDEEVGDVSKPLSGEELIKEAVIKAVTIHKPKAETIEEAKHEVMHVAIKAIDDARFQHVSESSIYQDAIEDMLEVFAEISKLGEVARQAVNWKLKDSGASFSTLAEEIGCSAQYVNQCYLKALQSNPVLGHIMRNRSSKVESYRSHHVQDAQSIANILKGL